MMAEYLQRGEALDYSNTEEAVIPAGTVVDLGTRIGVTGCDILPKETGSLHVIGVFQMPKDTAKEVKMGAALYWDKEAEKLTTDSGDGKTPAGYAAADADATAETALVNIGFPPAAAAAAVPVSIKLSDLTDVNAGSASEGQILKFTSSKWTAADETKHALKDLTDVDETSPTDGQVLTYKDEGSKWKPETAAGAG